MDNKQVEELRKLKTLLNEGIVSREEFIEARDKLLNKDESKPEISSYESHYTDGSPVKIQNETGSATENDSASSANSSIPASQTESDSSDAATKKVTAKGHEDNSKTFTIIIVAAIVVIALFVGLKMWSDHDTMVAAREALPGTWIYSFSDKEDGDEYAKYTESFTSKIVFDDNGNVEIYVGECVCKGHWDLNPDGDDVYITISDEEIVKGKSNYLSQILENMKYSTRPYYDGYELYWYTWDGEHVTNWNYYEHE